MEVWLHSFWMVMSPHPKSLCFNHGSAAPFSLLQYFEMYVIWGAHWIADEVSMRLGCDTSSTSKNYRHLEGSYCLRLWSQAVQIESLFLHGLIL